MTVRLPSITRFTVVALAGGLALGACSQAETDANAPVEAEPAATVASLDPEALMLRALECHRSMGRARQVPDRMPAEINERFARTPEIAFADLVLAGGRLGLSSEARQQAFNGGPNLPPAHEPTPPEYVAYMMECADITDRAAVLIAEQKAAKTTAG